MFYAPDGEHRIVWVSAPDSRQSRNIAACPTVAIRVFDTHSPIGKAEALYLEATASLVDEDAHLDAGRTPQRTPAGRSATRPR